MQRSGRRKQLYVQLQHFVKEGQTAGEFERLRVGVQMQYLLGRELDSLQLHLFGSIRFG